MSQLLVSRPVTGVALVTLNNPKKRNAMSEEMTAEWAAAMSDLASDRTLRAVVVTGTGKSFCSGGDMSWIASEPHASVHSLRERTLSFYRSWLSVRKLEVPTIAAINGPAVGAGMCVALACDIRYASATASMSVPFVRLGMHPGMGSTWLLPNVIGAAAARDLLLTGRTIDAAEALSLRLVTRLLPNENFLDEVLETAAGIASTAPIASRLTTLSLRGGGPRDVDEALQWEGFAQPVTLATSDLQEGILAAVERRLPDFKGY